MVPAVIAFCNGSPEMWGQSAQSKPKYEETLRLSEWAVKMRYGCRVPTVTGHDCDILTASGMKWIEEIVSLVDRQTEPKPPTKAADIIEGLLYAGNIRDLIGVAKSIEQSAIDYYKSVAASLPSSDTIQAIIRAEQAHLRMLDDY